MDDRALWDLQYASAETPWVTNAPSTELKRLVECGGLSPGTALDIGCGVGDNAAYLVARGWRVVAVDHSSEAIRAARARFSNLDRLTLVEADICDGALGRFDLVFDRGCYHCLKSIGRAGLYTDALRAATTHGSIFLCLAGNADQRGWSGPPRSTAAELISDFEPIFELLDLRRFTFDDARLPQGPLGWSSLWRRRHEP